MSRLAKKPIKAPTGVSIDYLGGFLNVKGPKGEIKKELPPQISIEEKDGGLMVVLKSSNKNDQPFLGTYAALLKNLIKGVTEGFEKKLEIEGVGYRVQMDGQNLSLSLGFTHPVKIEAPKGITFKVEKNSIFINGADKEQVGRVSAEIRAKRPPEPYKGKGIHYFGEVIRRKAGKKATSTA